MEKKLNGYQGALSPQQIAEGINAANKNAYRLAKDAKLIFDASRYPSAASFAILSIEESGKVSILCRLALAKDEKEIAEHWREYRSRTKENVSWILPELSAKAGRTLWAMQNDTEVRIKIGARRLEDLRPIFDENGSHQMEQRYDRKWAFCQRRK